MRKNLFRDWSKSDFGYALKFIANVWKKNGQYIFCGLSTLFCIVIIWLSRPMDDFFLPVGLIISFLMFFRLRFAHIEIESCWIRYSWAVLNYGLYALIMHLIPNYSFGFLVALIAHIFLYSWASYLSYLLGLTNIKEDYDFFYAKKTRFNGACLSMLICAVCLFVHVIREENHRDNELFAKTEYVRVINWYREIIQGNTYYIVKLPGKTIAVNPQEYPQIRDINDKTQIKVLTGVTTYNSFPEIKRLEIKNY